MIIYLVDSVCPLNANLCQKDLGWIDKDLGWIDLGLGCEKLHYLGLISKGPANQYTPRIKNKHFLIKILIKTRYRLNQL